MIEHTQALIHQYQFANRAFSTLLKQKLPTEAFQIQNTLLIEQYPYFVPPYLEVLEHLEETDDHIAYNNFIAYSQQRLHSLWCSGDVLSEILQHFDFATLHAFKYLLIRLQACARDDADTERLSHARDSVVAQLKRTEPASPQWHLLPRRGECEDVEPFKQELDGKEHFWFANTRRQRRIAHHTYTQAIVLRKLIHRDATPRSLAGPHESQPTLLAPFFPHTLQYAENVAQTTHCGLGRVALIRLHAGHMAYRHCDREQHLIGRDRYHFVISAQAGNILYAGDEVLQVKEGQLIKYDNKVQHKSYNESDAWRVHLIFDMFPL